MSLGAAFTRKLSPAPPNAMAPYASASIPPFAAFGRAWMSAHVEQERGDGRHVDGAHDRLRCGDVRPDRLLTDVGGGVEPGDRVLREQEAHGEQVDRDERAAGPARET